MRWNWIHGRNQDLTWYLGSALAGWLYVALVLVLGRDLEDPIRDPFYVLRLGEVSLPLTLGLLVIASWAVLIDAPHLWATLARTVLDPDEWAQRRGVLLGSLAFFAVGPVAILGPHVLSTVVPLPAGFVAGSQALFFLAFRFWAYYHVVRQHWGFMVLYKRANEDIGDPDEDRADAWFFNAALYLPILFFVSAPWYASTGMPDLGLGISVGSGWTLAALLHGASLAAFGAAVLAYAAFQLRAYRRGRPRNGPKLLLLLSVVPLHALVFLHPLLALFVVPVVTVGHNLQYHRIVWVYGRRKYRADSTPRLRFARAAFRSIPVYAGLGLGFTLLFYRGPWVDFAQGRAAAVVNDWVAAALGMLAGTEWPDPGNVGARVAATFLLGWAMQHYYLDSRIWRLRRDPDVARHLD